MFSTSRRLLTRKNVMTVIEIGVMLLIVSRLISMTRPSSKNKASPKPISAKEVDEADDDVISVAAKLRKRQKAVDVVGHGSVQIQGGRRSYREVRAFKPYYGGSNPNPAVFDAQNNNKNNNNDKGGFVLHEGNYYAISGVDIVQGKRRHRAESSEGLFTPNTPAPVYLPSLRYATTDVLEQRTEQYCGVSSNSNNTAATDNANGLDLHNTPRQASNIYVNMVLDVVGAAYIHSSAATTASKVSLAQFGCGCGERVLELAGRRAVVVTPKMKPLSVEAQLFQRDILSSVIGIEEVRAAVKAAQMRKQGERGGARSVPMPVEFVFSENLPELTTNADRVAVARELSIHAAFDFILEDAHVLERHRVGKLCDVFDSLKATFLKRAGQKGTPFTGLVLSHVTQILPHALLSCVTKESTTSDMSHFVPADPVDLRSTLWATYPIGVADEETKQQQQIEYVTIGFISRSALLTGGAKTGGLLVNDDYDRTTYFVFMFFGPKATIPKQGDLPRLSSFYYKSKPNF